MTTRSKERWQSSSSPKMSMDKDGSTTMSENTKDGETETASSQSRDERYPTPQTSTENNEGEIGTSKQIQPEATSMQQQTSTPIKSSHTFLYTSSAKVEEVPSVLQSGISRKRAKMRVTSTIGFDLPIRSDETKGRGSRESSEPEGDRLLSSSSSSTANLQTSGDDRRGSEEREDVLRRGANERSIDRRRDGVAMQIKERGKGVPIPTSPSLALQRQAGSSNWDTGSDIREQSTIRKQNSACDACRSRKVRCNRVPGEDRCAHCKSKGINCTTHFVQSAAIGGKRTPKKQQLQALNEMPQQERLAGISSIAPIRTLERNDLIKYLLLREVDYANVVEGLSYHQIKGRPLPISTSESRLFQSAIRQNFVMDLIETYFAIVHTRYPIMDPVEFRKRFDHPMIENGGPPADVLVAVVLAWGAKFSEHPIILSDRREAIHELMPLQRTKREAATNSSTMAEVAIANPVQLNDQGKSRLSGLIVGRSRIAEDLVIKAQEVLDRNKVHRIASMDHIRAALIVEALFWKPAYDSSQDITINKGGKRALTRPGLYIAQGNWVTSAIWHLKSLQIHHQESIDGIVDPLQRTLVGMCWWLACMMDAHMCAFYRRKPLLSKEDYTTESPAPPPAPEQQGPHPLGSELAYRVWINSATDQVEMMRMVCHTLWSPKTMRQGIQVVELEKLVTMAMAWREQHLSYVGAPSPSWPPQWNFADAVTACSTDMNYHIVWILMWEAVEEFGIAELKNAIDTSNTYNMSTLYIARNSSSSTTSSSSYPLGSSKGQLEFELNQIRNLRGRIFEEALNAALRIANLSQVLCDNGYLRLEPGIMKWTMNEAGFCLTQFKRKEVLSIIDALRQYGQAFEECYEQANELEKVAGEYLVFEPHSSSSSSSSSSSISMGQAATSSLVPSGIPMHVEEYVPKPAATPFFPYQRQDTIGTHQPLSSSPTHPSYAYHASAQHSQSSSSNASMGTYSTSASSSVRHSSQFHHQQSTSSHDQRYGYPPYDFPYSQQQQSYQKRPLSSQQLTYQQQTQRPLEFSSFGKDEREGAGGARLSTPSHY